jgi:membrane fusion protein, heavy metal efflux system
VRNTGILALLLILVACRKGESPQSELSKPQESVSITHWTDRTELFLEYAPLTAGNKSRFAIHLTNLSDFKPVKEGVVEVELRRPEGQVTKFAAQGPSRPGIFGVDVVANEPGQHNLSVRLGSASLNDLHELPPVIVYANGEEAASAPQSKGQETVAFLKEQQWTLDFATETAGERSLRNSLRITAEIQPRTGGMAEVTVPFTARLVRRGDLPALGTSVRKGQVLGGLIPPTSNPADLPALELARAEAGAALELARKDRARAERLFSEGAVPLRRVEEARSIEATSNARLKAAEARIAQYEATRDADDESPGTRVFLLRAPISGVIAETHATSGANVEAGENLFKIVDVEKVYAVGLVPEKDMPMLHRILGAELEFPGLSQPRSVGRLISVGRLVDSQSRTVKIIYEIDNSDRVLAVGQSGALRIFTSVGSKKPAVPKAAIVDDAGRPVVFVQVEGEAFARRPVTLGSSEGGYVEVAEGIRVGERVVTRGAHLIRLAALSTQVPAHGHVH